jgi:predicted sulfurtransferase
MPETACVKSFLNASAYKFVQISEDQLEYIRSELKTNANPDLCGTILLSQEGTNIRLSGTHEAVKEFPSILEACFPGFRGIHWKFTGMKCHSRTNLLLANNTT